MKYIFLVILILYLTAFVIISLFDLKKVRGFMEFSVAGKSQSTFAVTMTLLATMLGASTTIGLTDTVDQIGFPGIWWLIFGALGLILQSFILSEKVRHLSADTLPDLVGKIVGKPAEILLALIIVISWIGVIAGQLVAMNSLITFAVGKSSRILFIIVSLIVIGYTMLGGQLSVVKTDKVQLCIILGGIIISCIYLYLIRGGNTSDVVNNIEFLNESYRAKNLFTQIFVIGGVYFLGPDIMSRNFLSKDEKTAKRSSLIAGLMLLLYSVMITFIGMWVKYNVSPDQLGETSALMYVVGILPRVVSIIMIFGLLSAILSSTDTCIINASTIFVKDILRKESVLAVRITVLVMGLLALGLALMGRGDIMSLLTGAYSIYTPGVIFPLLVAILAYGKREIRLWIWLLAAVSGGLVGIFVTPLLGMGISLVLSLLSIKKMD